MANRTQRDSQRSKFYNWMRDFSLVHTEVCGIAPHLIEDVISEAVKSYGYPVPTFKHHNSGGYQLRYSTITLPKLKNMHPNDISVLVGWWIYKQRQNTLSEGWHGPTFCRVWAETYSKLTGVPVADIVNSMRASKLKVMGAAGASPAGPRVVKKYERLKNRAQELDAAIKRGRKEFEEFLQPILKELETTRAELKKVESNIRG